MNPKMKQLVDKLAADGRVSAAEVLEMRAATFSDGAVSRDEADAMFVLNGKVDGDDPAWNDCFIEAICDHLLLTQEPQGHVSDEGAAWLAAKINGGHVIEPATETALVLKLLDKADSAPASLAKLARECVSRGVASNGGVIGAAETSHIARVLFASAGSGTTSVTREEADWLFALDAETQGKAHAPAWRDLFISAVMNHLFAAGPSALLDRSAMLGREAWIRKRGDGNLGSFLAGVFGRGPQGYVERVDQDGPIQSQFTEVNRREADMKVASALDAKEAAWLSSRVDASGRTANGLALLDAVEKAKKSA